MLETFKVRLVSLLRWSERYTKTDMVYLTRGGFWLVVGHAVQVISGLILAVAFANLLPKEVYGTYQFIMAMGVVISACTLTGMSAAITREVARGSDGALRSGFHTQMVWSIGVVFAGAALGAYYYVNGNNTLALSFLIVGAFSPFLAGFGLTKAYFIGKQLFRDSAIVGLWRRFIPVVALVSTIMLTHNPVILVLVYFASNTVSAGLLYLLVVKRYNLPKHSDQDMVSYSKHLSFIKAFGDVLSQADKVVVWVFLGAVPLATYTLAQLPVRHIKEAFGLLYPLTFSKVSSKELSELKEILPRKARTLFFATLAAVSLYMLAAPYIFAILFPLYPDAVPLSQALALTVLSKPRSLYGQAFLAHKRKREQYIVTMSSNVLKIALLLLLVSTYGIWGVVYALITVEIYSIVLLQYLLATAKE